MRFLLLKWVIFGSNTSSRMMNGAIHQNENLIVCVDLCRKHYDPFMTDLWMHRCMRVKGDNISRQHNNPLREQRFTCESLRAAHNMVILICIHVRGSLWRFFSSTEAHSSRRDLLDSFQMWICEAEGKQCSVKWNIIKRNDKNEPVVDTNLY